MTESVTTTEAAERHYRDGLRRLQTGDRDGAYRAFVDAVRVDDSLAAAHYRIGNHFRMSARPDLAERALRAAIARDAHLFDAYASLAFLYQQAGRGDFITHLFEHFLQHNRGDADGTAKAASLLMDFRQYRAAAGCYERLCMLTPRSAAPYLGLGECLQKQGDYPAAETALLYAIDRDPDCGAAYLKLAHNRRMGAADAALAARFEQVLAEPCLSRPTIVCLHFALGKIYDDLERYAEAFAHFEQGNRLRQADQRFDRQAWRRLLEGMREQRGVLAVRAQSSDGADVRPIFVVGMLRSGTTLVERILGRHPDVQAMGELELVDRLAQRTAQLTGLAYPASLPALSDRQIAGLRAEYRAQWSVQARRARAAVDKNPLNFLHLALIRTVFPEAVIVHCVRDPRDTCLSIYFQNFAHERNAYAYALDDIAYVYRGYRQLMDHYAQVLPGSIHTVEYERLVADPENESRRLVAAAELPWNDRCLEHHLGGEAIATASVWQARQPIYTRSVGRWRHYEPHLAPLMAALGDLVAD